jgi:enoyl-CoA hydratase/carnithine racemase
MGDPAATKLDLKETRYDVDDRVARITLYRPDRLNAFTYTMRDELMALFDAADRDDAVRAIVVTGEGRAFCAGADLGSGAGTFVREAHVAHYRDGGGMVSLAIHRCRKPVIAAINGPAVGVGITMTLPMDMRIVAEDAKIGFVFARRGIVPEACSSWFLPRIIGIAKATELVCTGRVFRAKEESGSGLFNHVVPAEEVLPLATRIAREIADNTSATSVALAKALLWHGLGDPDPQTAHLNDSRCMFWAGKQPDAFEGVQSFLEKRQPEFTMSATTDMPEFYPWWVEPKV